MSAVRNGYLVLKDIWKFLLKNYAMAFHSSNTVNWAFLINIRDLRNFVLSFPLGAIFMPKASLYSV